MNSSADSQPLPNPSGVVTLMVVTGDHVPSFKNRKRAIMDSKTGKMRTLTEPRTKKRMALLESRIESALYSSCQTGVAATDSACLKQLRTVLFECSDDSLAEIPEFSYGVEYVQPGAEGVQIIIEQIHEKPQPSKP